MSNNNNRPDVYFKKNINPNREKDLKTQKIAIIFLAVFGVFLISMSLVQFKNRITSPFENSDSSADKTSEDEMLNFHLYVLANQDTDNDGISDYDELYTYSTSAYLEDSDSDNISDYDEIAKGTDPNCPEGEDCSISSNFVVNASSTSPVDELNNITTEDVTYSEDDTENVLVDTMITGNIDVSVLRQLMLTNGFSQEDIDQISDEDLEAIYVNAVTEQASNVNKE